MTGSITIERILDVETMTTEYSLTVLAMDGGDPPRRYCMTAILDSNIMSRAYRLPKQEEGICNSVHANNALKIIAIGTQSIQRSHIKLLSRFSFCQVQSVFARCMPSSPL